MERYIKLLILPKLIDRFNATLLIIATKFVVENNKLILKFMWKQRTWNVQSNLLKKENN